MLSNNLLCELSFQIQLKSEACKNMHLDLLCKILVTFCPLKNGCIQNSEQTFIGWEK